MRSIVLYVYFFFFNDTATTEIYTLSLHDALPILLVTGHTMASSPVFKNLLEKMASKLKTPRQAIIVVTLVSTIACILNWGFGDRKSTRLNSSHANISYAVFCLKKKKKY